MNCAVCNKPVYAMEKENFHDNYYHKTCFRCQTCLQPIRSPLSAQAIHGKPYCADHYKTVINESGGKAHLLDAASPGRKSVSAIGVRMGVASPKCGACDKSVYQAELVQLMETCYHKKCFKCTACEQPIRNVGNAKTLHGKPYCSDHYRSTIRESGNKAEITGEGAPVLNRVTSPGGTTMKVIVPSCGVCHENVYSAEEVIHSGTSFHKKCFKCTTCSQPIRMIKTAEFLHGKPYCADHYKQIRIESGDRAHSQGIGAPKQKPLQAGGVTMKSLSGSCANCPKPLYDLEKVDFQGKSYHKSCFKCSVCSNPIRIIKSAQSIRGEPFCEDHYKQKLLDSGGKAEL